MSEFTNFFASMSESAHATPCSSTKRYPRSTTFQPSIDVYERTGTIPVIAEWPGAEKKAINVAGHNGMLSISGVRMKYIPPKRTTRVPNGTSHPEE
jgi:HSP20 family molecular chaperone IbpA